MSGALVPYLTAPSAFDRQDRRLVGARGTRVTFADGVSAQCGTSGLWNVNFGYGHPVVAEAVAKVLRGAAYLPLFRHSHPYAEAAADALVELLGVGHFRHVVFSTSGSAANDAVMKLVRQRAALVGEPDRSLVVGLRGSYHGQTYGSLALSGDDLGQATYRVDQRFVRHLDPFDPDGLDRFLAASGSRVAAVVVEPVLGSGTVPVPDDFVRRVLDGRHRHGYLVVADEVATGFHRTGPLFAHQSWPSEPDIVVLSKALTNGTCAAAALVISGRAFEPFVASDAVFVHGETQGGSPPSCAAITATVGIASSAAVAEAAAAAGDHLGAMLDEVARDEPSVTGVVGRGCFRSLRLVDQQGGPLDAPGVAAACERVRRAGAWVHPGPSALQVIPPVVSTDLEIDVIAHAVAEGLAAHRRGAGRAEDAHVAV